MDWWWMGVWTLHHLSIVLFGSIKYHSQFRWARISCPYDRYIYLHVQVIFMVNVPVAVSTFTSAWDWEWSWKLYRTSPTFVQFPRRSDALAQTTILLYIWYSRICLAIRCLAKSDLKKYSPSNGGWFHGDLYLYPMGTNPFQTNHKQKQQIRLQQLFENTSKTWNSLHVGWNDTMETPPVFSMCSSRV